MPAPTGPTGASTVSVCLCTFDGERFVAELLESLAAQSRAPDELVVCDDGSTDGTVALVEAFARHAPFPVRVHLNAERAGIVGNFEQALTLATGDVLLPCDQDDVWAPEKIEVVSARLAARDRPDAVLHDSSLLDEAGAPVHGSLWQLVGFDHRAQEQFTASPLGYLIRRPVAAGHAFAFRASTLPLLLPFSRAANYDSWIAQLLAARGPIALVGEPLVAYRLHGANAVGLRRRQPVGALLRTGGPAGGRFGRSAAGLWDLEARLDERAPGALTPQLRDDLGRAARHLEGRAGLGTSTSRRAAARWVAGELRRGSYGRYSNGVRSAGFDLWRGSRRPSRPADRRASVGPSKPRTPGRVAAVVVEYHSGDALGRCLASLQPSGVDEIVVVDNGAADARSAPPPGIPPSVRWLPSQENPGFGGGVNRGAAVVDAELLLVCNPDIVVEEGALAVLRGVLEREPATGAVGPALVGRDGRVAQSARSFPTIRGSSVQAFLGLLRPAGRRSREYRSRNWARAVGGVVDWVTGACMLVRGAAFDEVGGFDDRYFLYVEEVDLCWRLRQAGWQIRYEPAARVHHVGGVSTSGRPYRAIVAHHRSLWRFARTTTRGPSRIALPLVAAGLGARCAVACALRAAAAGRSRPASGPSAPPPTATSGR